MVPPFPLNPRTSLGNQLEQVAKLISVRTALGMSRQIFFCSLGGFDNHNGQVTAAKAKTGTHANLLAEVSGAMKAFYDATVKLGVASQVVTFTLSDFSRTYKPNGNLGTDHAWGAHHFVVGGSVRGGDFYGVAGSNGTVFPTLAAKRSGRYRSRRQRARALDTNDGNGSVRRSRSLPGLASGTQIFRRCFPNIGRFGQSNLGFFASSSSAKKKNRRNG